jgi:hypothetical protein
MRENFILSANKNNGYPSFTDSVDLENTDFYKNKNQFIANSINYPKFKTSSLADSVNIVNTAFYSDGKNYPQMKNVRFSLFLGAFANDTSLAKVVIPKSVKLIGDNAFRNTRLSSVKISSDCVYSQESFPDGCKIGFY